MILEKVTVGPMQVNCYILAAGKNDPAIIIDPGAEFRKIKAILDKYALKPAFVVNTHGHYDHIGCDDKFEVPVYIHRDDEVLLKNASLNLSAIFALGYEVKSEIRPLEEGHILESENIRLKVLHIPGHTAGGIALKMLKPDERIVFTGDNLFCQGIGRSDLAGGDEKLLIKSIREKLLSLPDDTMIYPGHGPSSTIGEEKAHNSFFR